MNSPPFFRSSFARYALAVGAIAMGFLLRQALTAWVGPGLPTYITFYPAVMLAALLGGLGPGLLATALAALATDYWILEPRSLFSVGSLRDGVGLGLFTCMGAFISAIAHLYQRARRKAAAYDQEQALRETRREKEFLAGLLEHAAQPFAVGYPDGRLGQLNRAYEQLTGYSAAELRALDWSATLTPPEWRELEKQKLDELHRTSQPVRYEKEYVRKDGSRVPIELLVHLVRGEAGKPGYYYSFLTDITERRRAEQAEQAERASAEHLRQLNAELQAANTSLHESRAAALNLMDDALAARQRAEQVSAELRHEVAERKQAEEALRASLDRYRSFLEVTGQVGWTTDGNGLVTEDMPVWRKFTGQRVEEIQGWGWSNALHPDDLERTAEVWRNAVEARTNYATEYRLRRHDGIYRDFLARSVPTLNDDGSVREWVGTCIDITERKQAEEKLRQFNTELEQRVAEQTAEIRRANETLEQRIAARTAELQAANEALRTSRRAALNLMEDALEARRQAEQTSAELRESEARERERAAELEAVLEAVPAAIWIAQDPESRRIVGNRASDRLLRLPAGANASLNAPEAERPVHYKAFKDGRELAGPELPVQRAARGETLADFEFSLVFNDGTVRHLLGNAAPFLDAQGQARGSVASFIDVTSRRQAQVALERSNQRLDLLADTASELLRSDTPQQVVASLCRKALEVLDCQAFFNFLVEEPPGIQNPRLHLNACGGIPEAQARKLEWLDYGVAVCGCAARDACRIVAEDIPHTPDPRTELVKSFGLQAYACHPLLSQGRVLGTLSFGTRTRTQFSDDELALMKAVADQVAIAMERLRAKEALQRANEELERRVAERTAELHAAWIYARGLLGASLDPLVTISPEGRITDVNQATEAATGVARARLIGSSFSDYFTQPQDAEAGYQRVLAEGLVRDYPLTIRQVSGQTIEVHYNATVYRNEAGAVQGVFAAARDVTERKAAEKRRAATNALLELFAHKTSSQDYFEAVVGVIRDWSGAERLGIRIRDEQGAIPYAACVGFDAAFLRLENHLSLERDTCCCVRAVAQTIEDQDRPGVTAGGSFRLDNAIEFLNGLPPDLRGRYRGNCMAFGFASVAVIPIRDRDQVLGAIHLADRRPGLFPPATVEFIESMAPLIGEAVRRFRAEAELNRYREHLEELVAQRTSELKGANAQLQTEIAERQHAQETLQRTAQKLARSNRDLEQFAYVASHDLQEPLRAVAGYVGLLERRCHDKLDAKSLDYIGGAADGAARMQGLIQDLLEFSRVGTRGKAMAPADLNATLAQALHNLRASIQEAEAKIITDPLPTLCVDATQIAQLFQNLIGNAIKFRGDRPPEIRVAARRQEGRWLFSVKDNGIGIEPEYFERIFQIFQRLHTRRTYPGTGIGLAICKRIVERHGGKIWVESQPSQGATFWFTIPEAEEPSADERPTRNFQLPTFNEGFG